MKKIRWCPLLLAVVTIGCSGGGSSEPAGETRSMDELAAMLDSAGTQRGERAPEEGVRRQPAVRRAAAPDLPSKRGFALHDLSNELAYVLVKADADRVADALARQLNGQVSKDITEGAVDPEQLMAIVFQLAGHPWTIYATWPGEQWTERVSKLSTDLNTDVITFASSDFSGWSFVELYRGGESVEAIHWGLDYSEEGLPGPDLSKWDTHTKITTDHGDGITLTDQFLFRSKLRKATEEDLKQGEAYVDWLFKEHDAYLPDAPDMPWIEESMVTSSLGTAAFAGVHAVLKSD